MLDFSDMKAGSGDLDVTMRAHLEHGKVFLFVLAKFSDDNVHAAGELVKFRAVKEGAQMEEALSLPIEATEDLMADLWECGVRPKGIELNDVKEMKAVKAHLEDARMMMIALWNKLNGGSSTIGPPRAQKPLPVAPIKIPDEITDDGNTVSPPLGLVKQTTTDGKGE